METSVIATGLIWLGLWSLHVALKSGKGSFLTRYFQTRALMVAFI